MKRVLVCVVLGALLVGLIGYFMRGQLVMAMLPTFLGANMSRDLVAQQPDGLHVMLCGAGSPLPDPDRSGPCVAVIAGDQVFIVDSGSGSTRVLQRAGIPMGSLEAVFLTHFHSDHIDGLGELEMTHWAAGAAEAPLPVYGPEGVEEVVDGINQAYGPLSREPSRPSWRRNHYARRGGCGGAALC